MARAHSSWFWVVFFSLSFITNVTYNQFIYPPLDKRNPYLLSSLNSGFGAINCTATSHDLDMDTAILYIEIPDTIPPSTISLSYISSDCQNCSSKPLPTFHSKNQLCSTINTDYDVTIISDTCSLRISPFEHASYNFTTDCVYKQVTTQSVPQSLYHDVGLFMLAIFLAVVSLTRRAIYNSDRIKKMKFPTDSEWNPTIPLQFHHRNNLIHRGVSLLEQDGSKESLIEAKSFKKMLRSNTPPHPCEPQPLLEPLNFASDVTNLSLEDRAKDFGEAFSSNQKGAKKRLASLDTFRGLSLSLMIFVNYGGGGYFFFNHSTWNGLTVADLLFPWFIWISGATFGLTYKFSQDHRAKYFRSVKLFLLGLVLNSVGSGGRMGLLRIPGVLQYFAVTNAYLTTISWIAEHEKHSFVDFCYFGGGLVAVGGYTLLTYYVEVPGCETGYLGPGGLHDGGAHYECTGGSHRKIDLMLFGESHIYQAPTCKSVYDCVSYDPEGSVGAIGACFLAFLGLLSGKVVKTYKLRGSWVVALLLTFGALEMAIAGFLCGFKTNDGISPVNKNMWSISFVVLMAGFGNVVLAVLYNMIDMQPNMQQKKFRRSSRKNDETPMTMTHGGNAAELGLLGGDGGVVSGYARMKYTGWPFKQVGMNSILIYSGHEILAGFMPFSMYIFADTDRNSHFECMLSNLTGVCVWVWVGVSLYNQDKIYSI